MKTSDNPRDAWMSWLAIVLGCILPLVGCQSYEPVPIDLESYRAEIASRLDDQETLRAFSQRMSGGETNEPSLFDLSDGMQGAEAEVVALFYNRTLRMARLRAGVALADRQTAGLWEDPVFGFNGAELLSPDGPFEYGLTGGLTLPISGRLGVEKDRVGAAYDAQLARVVDAEWSLRAEVRSAWANWSAAEERLKLIDQALLEIDIVIAVSDRLEKAGELKRIEARLLRTERIGLRIERASVHADRDQARLKLLGLMGLLPTTKIDLSPGMQAVAVPDIQDGIARLIRANTTLAVARADYAVAEQTLRLEVKKQYPDLELGLGYGSENKDDRLLLGASIRVPLLNANRNEIAKARANRELARADAESHFEALAFELTGLHARIDATRQQRDVLQNDLSPMLDEQAKELARLAELGEVDVLILLETTQRQYDAKRRLLDLRLMECLGEIELARLLGPDETLQPAPIESNTIKREASKGPTP